MKYLLSISWHAFKHLNVEEILDIFQKTDMSHIDGIELATLNYRDMLSILEYCIEKNMIFQCHAPKFKTKEMIYSYLDDINKLASIYKNSINIVLHPLEDENFNKSIDSTISYLSDIYSYICEKDINTTISLENLNFHHDINRINLSTIDNILSLYNSLKFTYDIGHDIYDNVTNTKLSEIQIDKINNVHLHTVYNNKDHENIIKYTDNNCYIFDAMNALEDISYNGNVVVEIGIDMYDGNEYNEKLINYINSIYSIKEMISLKENFEKN